VEGIVRRSSTPAALLAVVLTSTVSSTRAVDRPVVGTKLVVIDKVAVSGRAKTVFLARDGMVSPGAGMDSTDIEASLDVAYDGAHGTFVMPPGAQWDIDNGVPKYGNPLAPAGGTVKASTVKPGVLVKVVAKSLGDTPLDITLPPSGRLFVVHTVLNGGEERRHCTQFAACQHRTIAAGSGYKLVCRGLGAPDGACVATNPTCITTRYVDQGATVLDTCTNLEWEKKDAQDGIDDPGNLHDADNLYSWAGTCSGAPTKPCQPTAGAEAACKAATPPVFWAEGCEQCGGGEGTCTQFAGITTIWHWLEQVNLESFAGHVDWRLPTSAGSPQAPTDEAPELESIVEPGYLEGWCGGVPGPACIDPIFGPTDEFLYWTGSSRPPGSVAFAVAFFRNEVRTVDKTTRANSVRAVRQP
jgi:hypothetical protein